METVSLEVDMIDVEASTGAQIARNESRKISGKSHACPPQDKSVGPLDL